MLIVRTSINPFERLWRHIDPSDNRKVWSQHRSADLRWSCCLQDPPGGFGGVVSGACSDSASLFVPSGAFGASLP